MQTVTIKQIGKSHFICAGVSKLFRFQSAKQAIAFLANNKDIVNFWANSASVSVENSKMVEVSA